jgi:hypothetical protein
MVASRRVRARPSLNSRAASGSARGGRFRAPGVSLGPVQDGISAGLLSATGSPR